VDPLSRWSLERGQSSSGRSSLEQPSIERSYTSPSLDRIRASVERFNPFEEQSHITKLIARVKKGTLPLIALFEELLCLTNVVSNDTHFRLCKLLAEPENLEYMLLLLTGQVDTEVCGPDNEDQPAREKYRYNWLCATLITCGPKEMRIPIATSPGLAKILVDFFGSEQAYDEKMASYVVRVVSSVLHVMPVRLAELLLAHEAFVPNLVELVSSACVADLLPRFVSSKDFKSRDLLLYGPPIKQSIQVFGDLNILNLLVEKFEIAALSRDLERFTAECVLENSAQAISSIAIRAMMFPGYTNRTIPHPRTTNSSVRMLEVLSTPEPLVRMLEVSVAAYERTGRSKALSSTLTAISCIIQVLHKGRSSDSVSVLRQIKNLDPVALEVALFDRLELVTPFVRPNAKLPGSLRVDAVRYVVDLLCLCSKASVGRLSQTGVLSELLDLIFKHRYNDVLQKHVSCAVSISLQSRVSGLHIAWLGGTHLIERLLFEWDHLQLDDVLRGAAKVSKQPSYGGDVIDMVISVRDFLERKTMTQDTLSKIVGEKTLTAFNNLCEKRLAQVERFRTPQILKRRYQSRSALFPVGGGSEPDLAEGDGDKVYYQSLIEDLRAESRGEESAWSPLLEFVGSLTKSSEDAAPM